MLIEALFPMPEGASPDKTLLKKLTKNLNIEIVHFFEKVVQKKPVMRKLKMISRTK